MAVSRVVLYVFVVGFFRLEFFRLRGGGEMRDAVIVSAVRTAVGKAPKGTFRNTRPDEMGAAVIKEALGRVAGLELAKLKM